MSFFWTFKPPLPGDGITNLTVLAPDGDTLDVRRAVETQTPLNEPRNITVLAEGTIAAAYLLGAGSTLPAIRLFNQRGRPLTALVLIPGVNGCDGGNQSQVDIVARADGGFVVTLGDDNGNSDEMGVVSPAKFGTHSRLTDVRVAEFDADGNLIRDSYGNETADVTSWTDRQQSRGRAVLENGDMLIRAHRFHRRDPDPAHPPAVPGRRRQHHRHPRRRADR